MQPNRTIIAVALLAVIIALASPYTAAAQQAQRESSPDLSGLSPYWNSDVNRWAPFILSAAEERNLDPDLIAAVIWKESLGRAWERGPVGAVGLMGVMPFKWRPSAEELQNPWTNVAWGARTLVQTIRDGKGDLYYALAAYNGGWGQIHLRVTRGYAADVLNHYARAVAMRHGLPADGNWVAIFATEGMPGSNTITVVGPQRSLARYTERPWVQANIPTAPVGVRPHSTVITFVDDYGVERQVNVWLVAADNSPLEPSTVQIVLSPSPADYDTGELHTTLTSTPSPAPTNISAPAPADTIAAPTAMPVTPVPTPAITTVVPTLTPVPPVSPPTTTLPTTPTVECAGGPLQLNAWNIAKEWTADGWMATIFVQGHGGDCMYTYTWEGEIKGGPMPGSMTFEIYMTDHQAVIMGTAAVTSAGETVEVGLFLKPTGE
jgi:hypothetical protein